MDTRRAPEDVWLGGFAFGLPLVVYLVFVCRTIGPSDSAECVTAAAVWGVQHPPGYPLYTLLAGLAAHIPWGPIPWRVNLLSAWFDAGCTLLLYLSLRRLRCAPAASFAAALTLAFSRIFWHYSEVAEVFPLNDLLVAVMLYLAIRWREDVEQGSFDGARRRLFWFGLAVGGALSNQQTAVFLMPGFIYWFAIQGARRADCWAVARGLGLGLLPYLYLPIAAHFDPPLNWDDPRGPIAFLRAIVRADAGPFTLLYAPPEMQSPRFLQVPAFVLSFPESFGWAASLVGLWGMVSLARAGSGARPLNVLLWCSFLLSGPFFVLLGNMDFTKQPHQMAMLERFYLMPGVLFAVWIGLGAQALLALMRPFPVLLAAPVLALALALPPALANATAADMRNETLCLDLGHNILDSLPPGALLFVDGDLQTMSVEYAQMVEGLRPDVIVLCTPKLALPWYRDEVRRRYPQLMFPTDLPEDPRALLAMLNQAMHPIFGMLETSQLKGIPWGLVPRFINARRPVDHRLLAQQSWHIVQRYTFNVDRPYPDTTWESVVVRDMASLLCTDGYQLASVGMLAQAEQCFRGAIRVDSRYAEAYKGLGLFYLVTLHDPTSARPWLLQYVRMNPQDADSARIVNALQPAAASPQPTVSSSHRAGHDGGPRGRRGDKRHGR